MESVKIKDYMTHRPVFFKGNETVVEAVEKLLQSNISGAPVIDVDRHVIGFVSEQDCIKAMLSSTYHSGESSQNVCELMQKEVVTRKAYESVLQLAEDMLVIKPRVYPVVDDDEKLVGCITRTHVLKALDKHLHSIYEQGHRFV